MGEEMDSNGFFAVKGLLPAQFSPLLPAELVKGEVPSSSTQALRAGCSGQPEEASALSLTTFWFSEILQELKSQTASYLTREETGTKPFHKP